MNRADFMRNLAELLADMAPAEREEAIQYYNDYFDDAGAENEQSVIASLGTPEQLAETIKAGLFGSQTAGEFTEKGFSGYEQKKSNEVMNPNEPGTEGPDHNSRQGNNTGGAWQNGGYGNQNSGYGNAGGGQSENRNTDGYYQSGNGYDDRQNQYNGQSMESDRKSKKPMSPGAIILIVILCICASPILLGVGGGFLGVIIGILGALLGCVIGFGAAAFSLIIVGVCLFAYGIGLLFSVPLGGLCMMGAAMVCMAIGIFFAWIIVMICGMLIPALIRGIVKLFQSIFHRGGAAV